MHSAAIFTPPLLFLPLRTAGASTLRRENPERNFTAFASSSSKSNKPQAQSNLTGSAVLHALQRAVSEKEKKIVKKRKQQQQQQQQVNRMMERGNEGGKEEDLFDYGNVRDIEVRSDWEARIDQLEKKVQELQSQYHHY